MSFCCANERVTNRFSQILCTQNEELITAIHEASPQHQTIQAHVVEEILPDQLTEVADVKEVISQLLPTRKRKPRAKRPNPNGMLKR